MTLLAPRAIAPPRWRRLLAAAGLAALAAYTVFLARHAGRGFGGSDAAGYANTARDIFSRRLLVPIPGARELGLEGARWVQDFVPLAHELGPVPGTMVPYYPPGYPLHLALAAALGGWDPAPFFVNPVAAALCLLLMYALGRLLGLGPALSAAGSAILAAWSLFLFSAVQPLSDLTAALWSLAAVVAALHARRRFGWAALAGAAYGVAVIVRPANALLILPLAFALPWRLASFALFAAGGAPIAVFYGAWNRTLYGSPFRTGYTHQFSSELALSNFGPRFARYGAWLVDGLSPLVPAGWLAGVSLRGAGPARDRALLAVWFGSSLAFHCLWGPSDNWTYLRYMLPAVPAMIAGFLLALQALARRIAAPRRRAAVLVAVLAIVFVSERHDQGRRRPTSAAGLAVSPEACAELVRRAGGTPALAVSMDFSAAVRFYTPLVPVRWDVVAPEDFRKLSATALAKGWRVFAVLKPYEVNDAVGRVPGKWTFLGNVREAGIWELSATP